MLDILEVLRTFLLGIPSRNYGIRRKGGSHCHTVTYSLMKAHPLSPIPCNLFDGDSSIKHGASLGNVIDSIWVAHKVGRMGNITTSLHASLDIAASGHVPVEGRTEATPKRQSRSRNIILQEPVWYLFSSVLNPTCQFLNFEKLKIFKEISAQFSVGLIW